MNDIEIVSNAVYAHARSTETVIGRFDSNAPPNWLQIMEAIRAWRGDPATLGALQRVRASGIVLRTATRIESTSFADVADPRAAFMEIRPTRAFAYRDMRLDKTFDGVDESVRSKL